MECCPLKNILQSWYRDGTLYNMSYPRQREKFDEDMKLKQKENGKTSITEKKDYGEEQVKSKILINVKGMYE